MASIKDVARAAGVSTASVSYALNGSPKVGEATRERILQVARELDFIPNGLARNLRRRKTNLIGIFADGLSSAYFNEFIQGVQDALWPLGYGFVVANITPQMSIQGFRLLEERWVDGGIILSPHVLPVLELEKISRRIPLVLVDSRPASPDGTGAEGQPAGAGADNPEALAEVLPGPLAALGRPQTTPIAPVAEPGTGEPAAAGDEPLAGRPALARLVLENRAPAAEIAGLLCDRGCRRIGFMGGPVSSWDTRERFAAFARVLQDRGLEVAEDRVLHGNYWRPAARQAMLDFLDAGKQADAWFCANDDMALGVIQALEARNLRVPEDVAVTGFDDIEYAALVKPALTTVAVDRHAMGRQALELLVAMIDGHEVAGETPVPARVVRRASA